MRIRKDFISVKIFDFFLIRNFDDVPLKKFIAKYFNIKYLETPNLYIKFERFNLSKKKIRRNKFNLNRFHQIRDIE